MVASTANSGVVQSAMKLPAFARTARYSAKYRPAWRISQIGGGQTDSPVNTRRNGFAALSIPIALTGREDKEMGEEAIGRVNRVDRIVAPRSRLISTRTPASNRLNRTDYSA